MNLKLGEHTLRVVSGGVIADIEGGGDRRVGTALSQQRGDFGFPCRQPIPRLQVGHSALKRFRSTVLRGDAMLAELTAEISHLPKRLADLAKQPLSIVSE